VCLHGGSGRQPDLAARQLFLRQKISLMALVETLARRDAGDRRITFDAIATQIRLPRDEVRRGVHAQCCPILGRTG
jgi:hypothetical protein